MNNDNSLLIGKKPMMAYVLTAMTHFSRGKNDLTIKARGNSIKLAVDVAEVLRNKFLRESKIKDVKIGTVKVESHSKKKLSVSTIEITVSK